MNEKRYNSMIGNLNSSERKVLEAVPKQEHWSLEKIHSELHRQGIQIPRDKLSGCIRTLVEVGLVKVKNRLYIVAHIEKPGSTFNPLPLDKVIPKLANKPAEEPVIQEVPSTVPALAPSTLSLQKPTMTNATTSAVSTVASSEESKFDFLGAMANKAQTLRGRAAELERQAKAMLDEADELEDLGMKFAEYEQSVDAKLAQFKQFQAFMKSMQAA